MAAENKQIDELVERMEKLRVDCAALGLACHLTIARSDGTGGVHASGRVATEEEIKLLIMTVISDHIHASKNLGLNALAEQLMAIRGMFSVFWALESTVVERESTIDG